MAKDRKNEIKMVTMINNNIKKKKPSLINMTLKIIKNLNNDTKI